MAATRQSGSSSTSRPVGPGRPGGPGGGPGGGFASIERAKNARHALKRLWSFLVESWRDLLLVALLVIVSTGAAVFLPILQGRAIDDHILVGDLPGLARVLLLYLGVLTIQAGATFGQGWLMPAISQRTIRLIRKRLFEHLQLLSLRYFDSKPHGELMSRLTNDVETISTVLSSSATQLISSVLTILGVCLTMFVVNWRLALVTLISIPLMAVVTRYIAKHTRRGYREQQATLGAMNGIIEETISGERVVKAYAREQEAIADFEGSNQAYVKSAIFAQTLSGIVGPLSGLINHLSYAIVALVGAVMAINGLATVGTIAIFINYSRELGRPLMMIANLLNTIQSSLAGAERIFEVMEEVPELDQAVDATVLGHTDGDVVFDDVCFSYVPDVPVLKKVNLHAEPGQTVALVGPTGAGKTTVVNLLTRFYDIDAGSIRLDGVDLRQLDKDSLRQAIGLVLQDNFLFAESVMENIRYGRLDATDDEVVAAAQLANADHFVRRLPQGYGTNLSERGSNLSQGQRQLLAIARAMLANPQILILDEATSSVDTRTEVHIQEALLKLMEGRTAFVIAHRLSTIRKADQVLVINDGEIIERGAHESLLAQHGFYHNLYMSQFKGHASPVSVPAE